MSEKRSLILTIVGFTLFFLGMLALVLSLIDVRVTILNWITEYGGRPTALLVHLSMIIIGIITIVVARSNFAGEDN